MMWPYEGKPDESNILYVSEEKEDWWLLSVKDIHGLEEVVRPLGLHSVLAHQCLTFQENDCQLLGVDDTMAGFCWWCKERVPGDLKDIWMLHNFEAAGRQDMEHVEALVDEAETIYE